MGQAAVDVVHDLPLIVFGDDDLFRVASADVVSSASSIDFVLKLIELFGYE